MAASTVKTIPVLVFRCSSPYSYSADRLRSCVLAPGPGGAVKD
ncbi:hypothetical protein [Streptomyces sp. NBRC 110611]|nr:hypothetical protein [Streptomyces sp. NBRC 110611]